MDAPSIRIPALTKGNLKKFDVIDKSTGSEKTVVPCIKFEEKTPCFRMLHIDIFSSFLPAFDEILSIARIDSPCLLHPGLYSSSVYAEMLRLL